MKVARMLWPKLLLLFLIFTAYHRWFISPEIIGGDWPYYWQEFLREFSLYPSLWAPWQGNGLGGPNPLLGLNLFSSLLIVPLTQWLKLPWAAVYKLGWFSLFLVLSASSTWMLTKMVLGKLFKPALGALASLIFLTNTYILMLTGGGQMGVALAYSLSPLVLAFFIKFIDLLTPQDLNLKSQISNLKQLQSSLTAGLVLGLQVMLDPRIAYVTVAGVGIYYLINLNLKAQSLKLKTVALMIIPVIMMGLLNAFWLLPVVTMRHNPLAQLGSAYTSAEALKFFSFADFSHALSLLHPNWPENLFGKTYFLQPEFLILPIIAFGSLITIAKIKDGKDKNLSIIYFAFLGLLGASLAKGVNPPWGGVYQWLFAHFPGFVMFRDPTKFYLLTVISYSVLIPVSLVLISKKLGSVRGLVLGIIFLFFWLFTIRQAFLGQLGGTFSRREVPPEYVALKDFLDQQPEFFRTLWLPRLQRFASSTSLHMSIEAQPLFNATNAAQLARELQKPETPEFLAELGVKYVIIPFDSLGELFLEDRRYDEKQRQEYEKVLDQIPWLRKLKQGKLTIYTTPRSNDRFWFETGEILTYEKLNPGRYLVTARLTRPTTLFFSESYHPGWRAQTPDGPTISQKTAFGLNSFRLEKPGNYVLKIYFAPQKYVDIGGGLSLMVLFTSLGLVTWFSRRQTI